MKRKIGWLADRHDPPGGAELTQAEFRAAAPGSVEIVDWHAPGPGAPCEAYVVHNCLTYQAFPPDGVRVIRYVHDIRGVYAPQVDELIFCSPLQQERYGLEGHLIPPPVDLAAFHPKEGTERKGTCCVGTFMNPGKGGHLISEWADANEPVDVYGWGPFLPAGPNIRNCGAVEHPQLPQILQRYERFVFLPTALEPFGRCVVEAWASGCELIVNGNVGARYWIEEAPEKLESAAEDFWAVVLR